jgi:tetratricopeptide (TPR) repeat protein
LWNYAVSVDPGDFMAHANLGHILMAENRPYEGMPELAIAERLHKYSPQEMLRFAAFEVRYGYAADAAVLCEKVLHATQDPHLTIVAWTNLGIAKVTMGEYSEAKNDFETGLKIDPEDASVLMGMGLLSERKGEVEDAIGYYSHSVHNRPTDVGFFLLGTALEKSGRLSEASAAYAEGERASSDPQEVRRMVHQLVN